MATQSRESVTPFAPPTGIKRSFTLPAKLQQPGPKESSRLEGKTEAIETLYAHPNARIVHFTTSGPGASASNRRHSSYTSKEQDAPGTLPWKTSTERTAAAGAFRIYRVPGSVAFLNAGASFLKPVLAKSQCWCVDGEGIFVLKRGPTDYYRIELPHLSEEDKDAANDFRTALDQILLFEKTPCPFQRGFHVELPESPQVTYVPWKPKHRPISPIRRGSNDGTLYEGSGSRSRQRSVVNDNSRSSSRGSSPSGEPTLDYIRSSPAREYSPSPLRTPVRSASIKPTIGRFEVIDKDHQRDRLLSRERGQSPGSTTPISLHQSPTPTDFSPSSPFAFAQANPQKLGPNRFATRNVTAPAALIVKEMNETEAKKSASTVAHHIPTTDVIGVVQTSTAESEVNAAGTEQKVAGITSANGELPHMQTATDGDNTSSTLAVEAAGEIVPDMSCLVADTQPPEAINPHSETSQHVESLQYEHRPGSADSKKEFHDSSPPSVSQELISRHEDDISISEGRNLTERAQPGQITTKDLNLASFESNRQLSVEMPATLQTLNDISPERLDAAKSGLPTASDERVKTDNAMVDPSPAHSSLPEDSGHTSPITLESLPDFGIDMGHVEDDKVLDAHDNSITQIDIPNSVTESQKHGTLNDGPEEPDTPVWHSAGEVDTGNSSNSSAITSSTGRSFVTAPLIPPDVHIPPSSSQAARPSLTSRQQSGSSLSVPLHQRTRSKSPLPMTTNLYLSHQDSYEHIGAAIGEKMAGALLGPPLQLAAVMLRIATRFTNGVRIQDEEGRGWERRGEKGRRLPGTWESYSEDEGEIGSEWEEDYGISIYGVEKDASALRAEDEMLERAQ